MKMQSFAGASEGNPTGVYYTNIKKPVETEEE